ncbi:helix-turn-helix transcriptional regulator [Clostridium botulinum]|nr:helix-turn-helix transcriptional regulator [Clostridium botulinum]
MINEIAEKIRNLRKEKNLTLKDLSKKTGLSISFLSQVENNSSSLAITSLKKIADALNVPITDFFKTLELHKFLVKKQEREVFSIEGSDSKFIRLSGNFSERSMEAILVVIPAEKEHGHKFSHPGEEFIYVLEGAIVANVDGQDYFVNQGDSIHFPSTIPHILSNPLKTDSKILTVVYPIIF